MKVDTIQWIVIQINIPKNNTRRKQLYESKYFDSIHPWYDSRNCELNHNAWHTRNKGTENDWYESRKFESNQASRKKLQLKNEDFNTFDIQEPYDTMKQWLLGALTCSMLQLTLYKHHQNNLAN